YVTAASAASKRTLSALSQTTQTRIHGFRHQRLVVLYLALYSQVSQPGCLLRRIATIKPPKYRSGESSATSSATRNALDTNGSLWTKAAGVNTRTPRKPSSSTFGGKIRGSTYGASQRV